MRTPPGIKARAPPWYCVEQKPAHISDFVLHEVRCTLYTITTTSQSIEL